MRSRLSPGSRDLRTVLDGCCSSQDLRLGLHPLLADDGRGFPQSVIGRIGDPYVKRRRLSEDGSKRPGYEGMGLGLFIAKTLLERSGAKLTFSNSRRHGHASWTGQATGGAVIDVTWPRSALSEPTPSNSTAMGENKPNVAWP